MKLLHVRTSIQTFCPTCVLIFSLTYLLTYLLANLLTYICANILSHAIPVLTLIPTFALANFMWHMLGSLPTKLPLMICKIDGTHQLPHAIIRFSSDQQNGLPDVSHPLIARESKVKGMIGYSWCTQLLRISGDALNDVDVSSRDKSTDSI